VRRVLAVLAVAGGCLAVAPVADGEHDAYRAAVSYWAMRADFFDRPSGLYRERTGKAPIARAWPYSQALAATLAMADVPSRGRLYGRDVDRSVRALGRYADRTGVYRAVAGATGDVYYDDNEWIALELLRWYGRRHVRWALARAERVFAVVRSAWDTNRAHPCPGGVFWTTARRNEDRNAVTTATGALLAMRLYEATRHEHYVRWARRMLDWLDTCLSGPDGLLWDHVGLDGTVDAARWSYNQGTAIGAHVLLYELTNDAQSLRRAVDLANASLAYFNPAPTGSEPPFFLAIFFRNLLELERVTHDQRYGAAVAEYADAAWAGVRDPSSGLFRFHRGRERLLEQAAMVQIYAMLAAQTVTTGA
jgi:hypothetical protein